MRVPEHLAHKPIIAVDNYDTMDGKYKGNSDAKGLSIGKSQWNENEISAKVWRYSTKNQSGKWSRQSEELPLHRVLDLAILITSLYVSDDNNDIYITSLNEVIVDKHELVKVKEFLKTNEVYLKPRIQELKKLLEKIEL